MQKTKSGGIKFTADAGIPNEKAVPAHKAKLEKAMTAEERSVRQPTEPKPPRPTAAG